jgi:erythromycin esterase-like protein
MIDTQDDVRFRTDETDLLDHLHRIALPLQEERDLDPLLERIGETRYVLLGEASHGTSEYYTWRARISRRLIKEKDFSFIAVEGDWPDCYRVNCYAKGVEGSGETAREVLHAFDRWPTWMWANEEVVQLAEWLRSHNEELPEERMAGFYGLDVYSLWGSMQAVIRYLEQTNPDAVSTAWKAFRCFEPYAEDPQEYAWATMMVPASCEQEVVALLAQLRCDEADGRGADLLGREAYFNAEQNALVAKNAERYYRTMVRGGAASWNVRDRHIVETLDRLMQHQGPEAKAIVWEHNTHIGDARATDMAGAGMVNVGQLVREGHRPEEVVLVGFGSYEGSVIAAREWGAPMERMPVPPAMAESYEEILHRGNGRDGLIILSGGPDPGGLRATRGHRAIGVVYDPSRERFGSFVPTVLPSRYDAFLFLDQTRALHPLHLPVHAGHDLPETFLTGV